MTPQILLSLCLLLPLATGILCTALMKMRRLSVGIARLSCLLQLAVSLWLLAVVDQERYVVAQMGGWAAPFGISLVADRLAAAMVAATALVALLVVAFGLLNRKPNFGS